MRAKSAATLKTPSPHFAAAAPRPKSSGSPASTCARRAGETTLTAREREIAGLIGSGKTNREVAEALVISERTVETHVGAVFAKLGIANRRELAALLNATR